MGCIDGIVVVGTGGWGMCGDGEGEGVRVKDEMGWVELMRDEMMCFMTCNAMRALYNLA